MTTVFRLLSLIALAATVVVSCGGAQTGAGSADEGGTACLKGPAEWDLGGGTVESLRALAPGFLEFRPVGWTKPEGRQLIDGEVGRQRMTNSRRLKALKAYVAEGNAAGIAVERFELGDFSVAEIQPMKGRPKPTVRIWQYDDKHAALLATWTCPHYRATDSCRGRDLATEIVVDGTTSCLPDLGVKPQWSVEAMGTTFDLPPSKIQLVTLQRKLDPSKPLGVRLASLDTGHVHFEGAVVFGDFSGATPEELLFRQV